MLNHPTRLLFYFTLMTGTLISISSTSWLGAWLGLEINLLSFIPLMSNMNNQFATEAALKYFLTQALASAILLFSVITLSFQSSFLFSTFHDNFSLSIIISSTLLLKMGAAPFHFWFPGVMEGLDWFNGLILMTWQKIAPLMLISYVWTPNQFSFIIILVCILVGSIGGFNQTSLRKIMAYSSINHLGWMLSATLLGETYWMTYFGFYVFLSTSVILLFHAYQLSHINHFFNLPINNSILKLALFCNLLSLGGLPPFLGFLPKWILIQSLVAHHYTALVTMMVIFTLGTLYFYLRMGYSAFMLTHTQSKWILFMSFSPILQSLTILLLSLSLTGLIFAPLLSPIL
uniref:NADH-ubiquinone oxidoreductase chain 2 n=1 Tax=Epeorus dayongensis TaxID=2783890 RepID=A0A891T244_9INSE|nr:NADH dehydrogenase subunit 2 [Epeorus dayongensis]QRM91361.1 NADH dehydrogenase subunit 2 [Epeorus dayongensis]